MLLGMSFSAFAETDLQVDDQATDFIERTQATVKIPVERYFDSTDKSVHVESGSFEVRDGGWMVPDGDRSTLLSQAREPSLLERAIGGLLDLVFPSAHAQVGGITVQPDNIEIENEGPPFLRLHDTFGGNADVWELMGFDTDFLIFDSGSGSFPFSIARGAADSSLRINQAGNVGLGTSSPARQLHLRGDNAVFRMDRNQDSAAFILVRTDASNNPLKGFTVGVNASGADQGEFVINDLGTATGGAGDRRMTIKNNGDVEFSGQVTANGVVLTSSARHKANIQTLANAADKITLLRGVSFDWKSSHKPSIGLIAEEVAEVFPELVEHDPETGAALGVHYSALVGVLVEAVKDQQARITALEQASKDT